MKRNKRKHTLKKRSRGQCQVRIFHRDAQGQQTVDIIYVPQRRVQSVLEKAMSRADLRRDKSGGF